MASETATPNAIAALTEPLDGRWPLRFTLRGREFVLDTYGWAFGTDERGDYATVPAFPVAGGDRRKVTIRPADPVRVLSYVGHWDANREVFV